MATLVLLFCFVSLTLSTNIATFTDQRRSDSIGILNGPNGYPNGTCTPLHLNVGESFQVVTEDLGCAITIYGGNSDPASPCPSTTLQVAQLAQCYGSSWAYYSTDGCSIPTETPPSISTHRASRSHTSVIVGSILGGVTGIALLGILTFLYVRRALARRPLPPPDQEKPGKVNLMYIEKVPMELYAHEAAHEIRRDSRFIPPVELPGNARFS